MKIIFAFRTRLFRLSAFPSLSASASCSVLASFRKILSLFAMQLSIFLINGVAVATAAEKPPAPPEKSSSSNDSLYIISLTKSKVKRFFKKFLNFSFFFDISFRLSRFFLFFPPFQAFFKKTDGITQIVPRFMPPAAPLYACAYVFIWINSGKPPRHRI